MPLQGHWERQTTPLRRLTGRERKVAITVAAVTIAAIAALLLATIGDSRPEPSPGCIRAMTANVMGAEELNACGARARRLCAAHAVLEDPVARSIQASCDRAGYR